MDYQNLLVETRNRVRTITVNRPDKLNALNRKTLDELRSAFEQAGVDDEVGVIVLTGAGEKAFVAGADINEIRSQSPIEARAFSRHGQELMTTIQETEKPVIAAINGFCLGGGLELALACHLRLAAEEARLGLPEINLGIMPGFGGTQRLARLAGTGRALELALAGEPVTAERARELGVVNTVVPASELGTTVGKLAEKLAASAPEGLRGILQAVLRGREASLEAGLELETARFALCCATEDMQEGTGAFLEKRKPRFQGR